MTEKRLIPVNALIGLVTPGGLEPPVLAQAGYHAAGLEVGVVTPRGKVTIDVVLAHGTSGHLLACESKSGNNIEEDQARRYAELDGPTVVQAVLLTLKGRTEPYTEILYACMNEHVERILLGLQAIDLPFPVLTVHVSKITLENSETASEPLREAFAEPISLPRYPPRFIPFDHESSAEEVEPHVRAVLVASLTRRMPQISIATLTEHAAPHYVLYARSAQGQLRKKVAEAARRIAQGDQDTFEYHAPSPNRDGWVRFLHSPEENDPRGRTQAYQALARRGRRGPAGGRKPGEGQLDLLKELDEADTSDEGPGSEAEEGTS